jgi:YD repeat-containing protein
LALSGEIYRLAFTPGLLTTVYARPRSGQPAEDLLPDPASVLPADIASGQVADRGGYVDLDGDGHWWIPSGRLFRSPYTADDPAAELDHARRHFFLPARYRDPFGQTAAAAYDAYDLLLSETRDPLDNRVTVGERDPAGTLVAPGNDYRVLQPRLIMDANRNRSAVAFDALGMVVGTAVSGKPEESLGDTLEGFEADLAEADALDHVADPLTDPHAVLGRATSRLIHDLNAYRRTRETAAPRPSVVYALVRETHDADLAPGQRTKVQHSFAYSDGFGREIQRKVQAEPGPLAENGPVIDPRWVGSGWTIFNNKGRPVRQYEPFFADTHHFEFARIVGVSPILFYDPPERVIATLHPNHTHEKVVFDPWRQATFDVNDTVTSDPRTDRDIEGYVAAYFATQPPDWQTWHAARIAGGLGPPEQAAAAKAAAHAATPTVPHFDALGRTFLTIADNGRDEAGTPQKLRTRVELDIEGNQRAVIDALDRLLMRYDYDMLGNRIHQASMEAGERWMLNDVTGKPIRAWDSREQQLRTAYDPLRRPTETFLSEAAAPEILVGRTAYGEARPTPEATNLRGRVAEVFDQAGVVTSDDYDFNSRRASLCPCWRQPCTPCCRSPPLPWARPWAGRWRPARSAPLLPAGCRGARASQSKRPEY